MRKLDNVYQILMRIMTAISFITLLPTFVFMVYHLFVEFDLCRIVGSAVILCVSIHYNKSL